MANILIVEDEKSIRDLISLTLQMDNHTSTGTDNGEDALTLIQDNYFDLILLDIMIPKINGIELLPKILDKQMPVIFLTAKSSLQDKILGLRLGADDYITKPFEPLELLARIDVALRKNSFNNKSQENIITYYHLEIYPLQRLVKNNNIEVQLTAKEYSLFMEFIENKNTVLSRENLLNKIWGYEFYGETRTIDMHVKQIREKLQLKDYLKTIYKVGYKLKN
ncbi:response regulator transcription factor [Clostridium sp.]|uniref:response regulator transcription factor n=1 Tax=Clostridium sp. TaxID=1506 RepID=UPI003F2C7ACE